jgi:predicted nucleic acid-binding protein
MKPVFADTYFFFAIINPRDAGHQKALEAAQARTGPIVTTAWVLTELADGLAATPDRALYQSILDDLRNEPGTTIIPPSQEILERGEELYSARSDKQWSLTDCISFVMMNDLDISEALTADHHFEQAGFTALLK